MKTSCKTTIMTVMVASALLFIAQTAIHAATVTDTYPGHPGRWEGMTTNTVIEIKLDTPVAMVGAPAAPDIEYCVKKATFSGFDFVLTDVPCAVDVSSDRKTIILYPSGLALKHAERLCHDHAANATSIYGNREVLPEWFHCRSRVVRSVTQIPAISK